MGFDLDAIKEMTEHPEKETNLSSRIPKFLSMGVSTKSNNYETTLKVVLSAALHEGLDSETLENRIEYYEDRL